MKKQAVVRDEPWQSFYGPNLGYVMELYEQYLQDENAVEPEMCEFFSTWTPESKKETARREVIQNQSVGNVHIDKLLAAIKLIDRLRVYGHLAAEIYPLKNRKRETKLIDPEHYGLTEADLENLDAALIWPNAPSHITNGLEVYNHLKHVYTKSIAVEFHHVENLDEKQWLTEKFENELFSTSISPEKKISMLTRLIEVEEFEKFLHRTFVGQKRFSIEGLDAMIPILDEIISLSVQSGAKTINIGMAHRGRLNVLAHVLEKPYEMIFSEFQHAPNKELVPSEGSIGINYGWTGDVKYHLGLDRQIKDDNTVQARITLANNPSHLEFVSPVVEGFTRAAQDDRTNPGYPSHNPATALPILIHGDAAFPGQGIVAETLNLSSLFGYKTGGAIHIIANNTIGFTTESKDSRSTKYASDLAKGYEIPIIRVNADDPEACMIAVKLACEYRETFKKDFLIDLVGYRRFGHNEMDEPLATNPLLYSIIPAHPTVKTIYSKQLVAEGVITEKQVNTIEQSVQEKLRSAYEKVPKERHDSNVELDPPETVEKGLPKMNTSVPLNMLKEVNDGLLNWPKDFHVFNKLEKILKRRSDAFTKKDLVDWSLAEALAFGTIISDGVPIRLTGQDSERGTFAHRHIVLHDHETGEIFSPLHTLQTAKASFAVHNSPLSEASVVGFEYGYNVFAPETLVLWEAQFGDFANSAQVMFDQFVAAGRAKWGQKSGLVILLPHGYEGQGPEHSSGRVERFLQLAAENNWTVANLTSAAQYFHILRRQAAILQKDEVRPLVLMSPKSLLRNPNVASSASELTEGEFKAVIEQPKLGGTPEKVERIVLCSGKIAINLAENIQSFEEMDWLHILRIEEIYPFPFETLTNIIKRYPNLTELVWIQEEPKNMGAWNFVEPRIHSIAKEGVSIKYIGRRRRSSPAEGDPNVHKAEQARIITEALTRNIEGGL